jgi:putative membrane-bound dehydrogenase-like protein
MRIADVLHVFAGALIVLLPGVPGRAQAPDDRTKPAPASAGPDGPLTPEEAPRSFRIEPGVRLELVAAEPLIASPVALTFDGSGRLYVVENRGYPTGPGEGQPPAGRIARLEDTDGDGRMDRRTEFADGLTFPNGLMPWQDGLIVTCAPDVLLLRDGDGDGKADERRVLFTGFATTGSTQLRVSHPTLAIDNWVYLTSGLTGGNVVSPAAPDRPAVALGRTDFRFRPDGDAWEAADGGSQFGMTFDDFGRRFICYNRVQVQHVVISSKALRRNPHLASSETVQNCPAETVAEPLRGHGAAARLFPISRNITTADSHAGTFTAACAVTVYRGTGLPETFRGGAFSCDPTGNLVHFDRLVPRGVTFSASPARDGVEFLASSDSWFRPVFLAHGPEGALYVCDMYRKTIEHPDYLPVEIRKHTDFEGGKGMGRIWRVVRDDLPAERARDLRRVDLAAAPTPRLCEVLRDRDGWRRDTAHRLLLGGATGTRPSLCARWRRTRRPRRDGRPRAAPAGRVRRPDRRAVAPGAGAPRGAGARARAPVDRAPPGRRCPLAGGRAAACRGRGRPRAVPGGDRPGRVRRPGPGDRRGAGPHRRPRRRGPLVARGGLRRALRARGGFPRRAAGRAARGRPAAAGVARRAGAPAGREPAAAGVAGARSAASSPSGPASRRKNRRGWSPGSPRRRGNASERPTTSSRRVIGPAARTAR